MHTFKKLARVFWVAWLVITLLSGCAGLNKRVQTKIETSGSELTEVPVNVDRVNLKLLQGAGQITGLTVANPEGYVTENAFEMDLLQLNLGLLSIITGRHPLVLDELVIDSPVLNLELKKDGGLNLKEIRNNVERNIEKSERAVKKKQSGDKKSDEPRRISVSRLIIKDAKFNLHRRDGSVHSGTLPNIELTNIGGDEGVTIAGLSKVVVVAMSKEMLKIAVTRRLVEQAAGFQSQIDGTALEIFIADKVMSAVEPRLNLTTEQRTQLQMVIEMAVSEINKTIVAQAGLGLFDYQSLSRQLGAIAGTAEMRLTEFLDSQQMAEIKRYLAELTTKVVETVREVLFDQITTFLDLTPQQIERFRPIFREEATRWSSLLDRFRVTFEEFRSDFEALQKETRQKLEGILTEDQMRTLSETQQILREKIRDLISTDE